METGSLNKRFMARPLTIADFDFTKANPKCKKCYGRGWTGYITYPGEKAKRTIICKCVPLKTVEIVKVEEKKPEVRKSFMQKITDWIKKILKGGKKNGKDIQG